jgi:hypothetical protein
MVKPIQLTRAAVSAIAVASLAASTAFARPGDLPLRPAATQAQEYVQGISALTPEQLAGAFGTDQVGRRTPPRVESMGVHPANPTPVAPATPAVPLTRANDTGGIDWLSVAFGASAILALLLIVAVIRLGWPRVRPIRARRA